MTAVSSFRVMNAELGQPEWAYKDTTTSIVARGDQLVESSGKVIRQASASQNLTFAGVAMDSSPAGENNGFRFYPPTGRNLDVEFEYGLNSATTCVRGQNLAWSARQTLVATDTDATFVCSHANGTSGLVVRCKMKLGLNYMGDAS